MLSIMKKLLPLLLFCLVLITGCGGVVKQTDGDVSGSIKGKLINNSSNPIQGAEVTLTEITSGASAIASSSSFKTNIASLLSKGMAIFSTVASSSTDSNGNFVINNVKPGSYRLTAQANDLAGSISSVVVESSSVTDTGVLILKNTGEVYGNVNLADISNDSMAAVVLLGTSLVAYTDTNGNYRMFNVPVGSYDLVASKVGYIDSSATAITVTVNHTTTVNNISLAKSSSGGGSSTIETYINSNTTWTKQNSPYYIDNQVIVKDGVTLTIEPGVEIYFYPTGSLAVNGNIYAVGTLSNIIKIQRAGDFSYYSGGVALNKLSAINTLKYIEFNNNIISNFSDNSSITNVKFINSSLQSLSSRVTFDYCSFTSNVSNFSIGYLDNTAGSLTLTIKNSIFDIVPLIISNQSSSRTANITVENCNITNYSGSSINGSGSRITGTLNNNYIANNNGKTGATTANIWNPATDSKNPQWSLNSNWTISNPRSTALTGIGAGW